MTFLVNALIFFYVGASCVNFTIRCDGAAWSLHGLGGVLACLFRTLVAVPSAMYQGCKSQVPRTQPLCLNLLTRPLPASPPCSFTSKLICTQPICTQLA